MSHQASNLPDYGFVHEVSMTFSNFLPKNKLNFCTAINKLCFHFFSQLLQFCCLSSGFSVFSSLNLILNLFLLFKRFLDSFHNDSFTLIHNEQVMILDQRGHQIIKSVIYSLMIMIFFHKYVLDSF